MKLKLLIYLLLFSSGLHAQDLFQGNLFPADLIMKNREKISLTDQQAEKIKSIHAKNAGDFATLRWDLDAENEKLKKLLKEANLNGTAIQQQMDKVLQLETQLKKKQLSNLLALRAELKDQQVKELQTLSEGSTMTFAREGAKIIMEKIETEKHLTGSAASDDKKNKIYFQVEGSAFTPNESSPLYLIKENGKTKTISQLDFSNLSPTEIQSIEVFKGEKALEYGSKGKNGVIIITLKK